MRTLDCDWEALYVQGVHVVVGVDHCGQGVDVEGLLKGRRPGRGLGQAFGSFAKQGFDLNAELFVLVPKCGVEVPLNRGVLPLA